MLLLLDRGTEFEQIFRHCLVGSFQYVDQSRKVSNLVENESDGTELTLRKDPYRVL